MIVDKRTEIQTEKCNRCRVIYLVNPVTTKFHKTCKIVQDIRARNYKRK